jgi:hypothetical protein
LPRRVAEDVAEPAGESGPLPHARLDEKRRRLAAVFSFEVLLNLHEKSRRHQT